MRRLSFEDRYKSSVVTSAFWGSSAEQLLSAALGLGVLAIERPDRLLSVKMRRHVTAAAAAATAARAMTRMSRKRRAGARHKRHRRRTRRVQEASGYAWRIIARLRGLVRGLNHFGDE